MTAGCLKDDPEWRLIQEFVNRVLREGMEHEAERIKVSMKNARKNRKRILRVNNG